MIFKINFLIKSWLFSLQFFEMKRQRWNYYLPGFNDWLRRRRYFRSHQHAVNRLQRSGHFPHPDAEGPIDGHSLHFREC